MIREVADFRVAPERAAAFEEAVHRGVQQVIRHAAGFQRYCVERSIETPGRYLLVIEWGTVDDHMVGFRQSAAFADWRAIVGPFFLAPPSVEHFDAVAG
jgi:quinol monooxygenase YgiN